MSEHQWWEYPVYLALALFILSLFAVGWVSRVLWDSLVHGWQIGGRP